MLGLRFMSQLKELTQLFQRLGAPEPENWASSQINEGINQLGRFLFLRQAWREILDEDDHSWIQAQIDRSSQNPDAPCSSIGPALQNLLAQGAKPQDITDVVRVMQYELLFRLCYLLGDPGDLEGEVQNVSWGLVQFDEAGKAIDRIDGLHESVLGTDPTGREMRPRESRA
jgi:hypothetical protein